MSTIFRDLETLTAFHYVAAELSVSKAALRMGRSKSFISGQVRRLEANLKLPLFQMTTRSVELTDEGRILFDYSSGMLKRALETEDLLAEVREGLAGKLKVSMPISLGSAFGRPFFAYMLAKLPNLSIDLDLSNDERDFTRDQTDFAIRATRVYRPDLVAHPLGFIREAICVAPELYARLGPIDQAEGLARAPCILNSQESFAQEWALAHRGESFTIAVSGKHSTNLYDSARQLCLAGVGVAKLPLYLVREDFKAGRLQRLLPKFEIANQPLFLVHPQKRTKTKKHALARATILAWFAAQTGSFRPSS